MKAITHHNAPGFQLTSDDVPILAAVFDFRLSRIEHLAAVVQRSYKKVHLRLFKLHEHGYVARIELPLQKHVYAIAKRGVAVLVEQGVAPKETLEARRRHAELRPLFIEHQMLLADVHAALIASGRTGSVRLADWREGKNLWDKVQATIDGKRQEVPVRPDSFFSLEDSSRPAGKNRRHFILEADRSTMSHFRMKHKYVGYWTYLQSGRFTKKYGFERFRVVTMCITDERARNLCDLARQSLPVEARRYFLFASLSDVAGILDDTFWRADDFDSGQRHYLIPPMSTAAASSATV